MLDHFVGLALKGLSTHVINSLHATDLFPYPLKTSENQWFSEVFKGYRKRPVANVAVNVHLLGNSYIALLQCWWLILLLGFTRSHCEWFINSFFKVVRKRVPTNFIK